MTQLPAPDPLEFEREYDEHRADVVDFVRASFGNRVDLDEIYQEAWTVLLERRERGDVVVDPHNFLRTVAWREARCRLRRHRPVAISPTDFAFTSQADAGPLPDEAAQVRLDAATLREIIDDLEPRHSTVLKLRFDLQFTAAEIQEYLGVSPKRLEKIVTAAYKEVQACLQDDGGEPRFRRRQRSLLLACQTGVASARQVQRAQRMVDRDPGCRAMVAEMRRTLDELAALIPYPILTGLEPERTTRWRGTLGERLGVIRDYLADAMARTGGSGPTIEHAGAGAAATAGVGVAAKVALVCTVAAGGALTCVETGLFRRDPPHRPPTIEQAQKKRTKPPPREPKPVRVVVAKPGPKHKAPAKSAPKSTSAGSTSANAPPAPNPVPAGSTEFGPGAIGSDSPPPQPAAAPSGGGGEFTP